METPKDQLIELYYQRVQAMTEKINQLQNQLNYYENYHQEKVIN
jgi:conjugal transfer/entry exclusion protein